MRMKEKGFLEDLNRRFTVDPVSAGDYHRSADGYDLAAIFSIERERSPSADCHRVNYDEPIANEKGTHRQSPYPFFTLSL